MSATGIREDIGYVGADPQAKSPQTKRLHHIWKLTDRRHHQDRHVCIRCGCIRHVTQGQQVTSTRYTLGTAITDRAPPCQPVQTEQTPWSP